MNPPLLRIIPMRNARDGEERRIRVARGGKREREREAIIETGAEYSTLGRYLFSVKTRVTRRGRRTNPWARRTSPKAGFIGRVAAPKCLYMRGIRGERMIVDEKRITTDINSNRFHEKNICRKYLRIRPLLIYLHSILFDIKNQSDS